MKKNIITYIILLILISLNIMLIIENTKINQRHDKLAIEFSKNSENTLEKITNLNYSSNIESLESNVNDAINKIDNLNNKLNDLENKNNLEEYNNKIVSIKKEITNLKNNYDSLSSLLSNINNLEEKVTLLENSIPSNNNKQIIGKYKTILSSKETLTWSETETSFITIYEFKSNGDFLINEEKVGTYLNNDIMLKDSNDKNYRTGHCYYLNDTLYINLYYDNKNIVIGSDYYECETIK